VLETEDRHNLILGIATTLIDHPGFHADYRLWVVERDDAPLAAALITVPFRLVLAEPADPAALRVLVDAVSTDGVAVPGVVGNQPHVDEFVARWTQTTGETAELSMTQGVFALERVKPVPEVAGRPRRAGPGDKELLIDWYKEFAAEALGNEENPIRDRLEQTVDLQVDADHAAATWLWDVNGDPVALSSYGKGTPNGARIGPVYTPPQCRRRGYGTALVAAQSKWLLDHGRRFCFLYTDLANPTSNAIYRRIGYEQVAESAEYRFSMPPG
jgi:predicted GNAT family acetyltransferase